MHRETMKPLIFNIHHFALDDGPGIRTTVFFKGCPLSCIWCHNPESMDGDSEMAFYPALCIGCGDCVNVCPEAAIDPDSTDRDRIIRGKCTVCGKCAEACPAAALRVIGEYYAADELVNRLLKDRIFYETSRGGVTFSGGEPALYADYLSGVMKRLESENIHIAIQTSGMFDPSVFEEKLLPYIDLVYYDIKVFDNGKHKEYTGAGNGRILDNFVRLLKSGTEIIPRIPLVPGMSATKDNLIRTAEFLRDSGYREYELLPYNSGGIEKRNILGKELPRGLTDMHINPEKEKEYREIFSQCLIHSAAMTKIC